MTTKRELIDLAAKAAGITIGWERKRGKEVARQQSDGYCGLWQPLDDDGDALRLAATLRLHVLPGKHPGDGCTVETQRSGIAGCTAFYDDAAEQMRRAIVRAAAEIGRSMP